MKRIPQVYIAGKFRDLTRWDVVQNIRKAEEAGFTVAELGGYPVIPHANTGNFDGLVNDQFWLEGTLEQMCRCDAVVLVSNWKSSRGATAEREEALRLGMPVFASNDVFAIAGWIKRWTEENNQAQEATA